MSRATVEPTKQRFGRFAYGRKDEEYIVDFLNVTKRALSEEYYRIFNYHYLLGADWRLCCRRLGLDRGTFFHMVYRMEAQLGRVYRELQPYALYPLDEYFSGTLKGSKAFPAGGARIVPIGPPPKVVNPDKVEKSSRRYPVRKAA
ncbi:MAG TPA: hypothetical protein DEH78_28320 [Solibacterales bacterium]|nr:hypothetical protein [Bryobacterales bacterium]